MLFMILHFGNEVWRATPYGHITAFHPDSESIKIYPEYLQLYFVADKVPNNLVPTLHSPISTSTYSATSFRSLQEILEALLHHIKPKRVINAHHFHNELTTMPVHANSRRQHAMHVERRATLL